MRTLDLRILDLEHDISGRPDTVGTYVKAHSDLLLAAGAVMGGLYNRSKAPLLKPRLFRILPVFH